MDTAKSSRSVVPLELDEPTIDELLDNLTVTEDDLRHPLPGGFAEKPPEPDETEGAVDLLAPEVLFPNLELESG